MELLLELDPRSSDSGDAANDDTKITIGMGDLGTVGSLCI